MLRDETAAGQFTDFMREVEPRLRRALTAGSGSDLGVEATAEALAYGWQHWERVKEMGNPARLPLPGRVPEGEKAATGDTSELPDAASLARAVGGAIELGN